MQRELFLRCAGLLSAARAGVQCRLLSRARAAGGLLYTARRGLPRTSGGLSGALSLEQWLWLPA